MRQGTLQLVDCLSSYIILENDVLTQEFSHSPLQMTVIKTKKILVCLFRLHSFFFSSALQAMPLGTAEETKTIHQERRWQARETAEGTAKMQAVFISIVQSHCIFPGETSQHRDVFKQLFCFQNSIIPLKFKLTGCRAQD